MSRKRTKRAPLIALLIDFDNFVISRKFTLSEVTFRQLREHAGRQGVVVCAEAYLSPTSDRPKNVKKLTKVGIRSVVCPLAADGEDTVDERIQKRTRQLIMDRAVDRVLIVSLDSDFRYLVPFGASRGVRVDLIDFRKLPGRNDALSTSPHPGRVSDYRRAIEDMREGMPLMKVRASPVHALIRLVILQLMLIQSTRIRRHMNFRMLHERVFNGLNRVIDAEDLKPEVGGLLGALHDAGVLERRNHAGGRHYELNENDPILASCIKR